MRKLLGVFLAGLFFFLAWGAVRAAAPMGFVNDEAGVLTSEQKSQLENLAKNFEAETSNEIAVLITPELKEETIEEMAVRIFSEWGIGKKGQDNGVLILLAIKDREVRMEVGYSLEGQLTDLKTNQVINETMVPFLRQGNYFAAVEGATRRIMAVTKGEESVVTSPPPVRGAWDGEAIWLYFVIGYVFLGLFSRTKSWWLGGVLGAILGFWWAGLIGAFGIAIIGLILDFFLSKIGQLPWVKQMRTTTMGSGWGGSRGGGGGFGGFGGGSSGGGGASGKW